MIFDTVILESERIDLFFLSEHSVHVGQLLAIAARRMCRSDRLPSPGAYAHKRAACPSADTGMPCPNSKFRAIGGSLAVHSRIQGRSMSVYWSRSRESILRLNVNLRLWMFVWKLQLGDIVTCRDSDWKPIKASLKGPWYSANRVDSARRCQITNYTWHVFSLWIRRWFSVRKSLIWKSASCHKFHVVSQQ